MTLAHAPAPPELVPSVSDTENFDSLSMARRMALREMVESSATVVPSARRPRARRISPPSRRKTKPRSTPVSWIESSSNAR